MVMYADDGILYSDKPFEPTAPINHKLHEGKSRWLKKDDKWLSPFKFLLGLEYNGDAGTIRGNTRKGSRLEVDAKRSNVFTLIRALRAVFYEDKDLEAISNSNVFGLFISKLYCGS